MPTALQVAHFQTILLQLAQGANHVVANVWRGDAGHYAHIIDPFLTAAAQLSAHWYHSLAPEEPFKVRPGPLPEADALTKNAEYAKSTPEPTRTLEGATTRHVFQTSAATIVTNANREYIRYARQARPDACAFCRLLATRTTGLYHEKGIRVNPETGEYQLVVVGRGGRTRGTRQIGELYHDHCNCVAVPIRPGDSYQPPDYAAQWEDDYKAAMSDDDVHSFDQIVNHMRRTEYAREHPQPGSPEAAAYHPFDVNTYTATPQTPAAQ